MSKTVCMICLRSNIVRTEDIDDTLLAFYEELIYNDMYVHDDLKMCPLCEHQLKKFYNFRQKCRRALILLKNWSIHHKTAIEDLYTKLPRSPIGVCTKAALQKMFVYGYSDHNSTTETGDQSKYSNGSVLIIKTIEPKQKKVINGNLKAYLEGFMENNEEDNDNGEVDNDGEITDVSDKVLDNNTKKITENIFKHDNDNMKKPENIFNRIRMRICLKQKVNYKRKRVNLKKLEKIKQREEMESLQLTNPEEFLKRKQEMREINILKRKTKRAQNLKEMLVRRLERGEFQDVEDLGVTMNKEVFLGMFDKCTLNSLAIQGVLKTNIDSSKIRRFLESLLRRFNPQYESMFHVECLDTHAKRVAEFQSRQHSKEYIEAHHRCEICFKVFEVQCTLDYHMKWHNVDLNKSQECDICSLRFKRRGLSHHIFKQHSFVYRCKLCPFHTYCTDHMKIHYQYHQGVTYTCPVCHKVFRCRSTMINHRRQSHKTRHQCPFCAKTLVSEVGVRQHVALKHSNEPTELVASTPALQCDACELAFHNSGALKRHVYRDHENPRQDAGNKKKYLCFFCKETFETLVELQTHKTEMEHRGKRQRPQPRPDEPFITCPVCNQMVANDSKRSLFQHHSKVHPGVKYESACDTCNYLCEQCGKAFKSYSVYRDHINTHTGAKPYECSECGARFASRAQAAIHVGRHGPPRYRCKICPKMFSAATSRNLHMRIHIGDRRFKCDVCSKGFLHKASLRLHIDSVHNNIKRIRPRNGKPRPKKFNKELPVPIERDEELTFDENIYYMDVINEEIVESNIEM